ncbi:H-type lectin domain protein [Roseivivax jejudonensis]|uniref:H-type lectin domain protein n=1 Tax=Roseivivax jejudonensis TaxID=1529041 RepID=A0A1X6ZI85_9RHOB|nr:H-type lectin domain-containing protein [Roseivivax jejudonensis]SLN51816.1 H-type lectin domain protein [Roseivivax jejudonensis]
MRTFDSHRMGVAQGTVELFSDFADGGEMWTGSGSRERRRRVEFPDPFSAPPAVHLSLALWDVDAAANMRADLSTENVAADGFEMVFRTWGDTRIARVRLSWMAIGPVASEDDWTLY